MRERISRNEFLFVIVSTFPTVVPSKRCSLVDELLKKINFGIHVAAKPQINKPIFLVLSKKNINVEHILLTLMIKKN